MVNPLKRSKKGTREWVISWAVGWVVVYVVIVLIQLLYPADVSRFIGGLILVTLIAAGVMRVVVAEYRKEQRRALQLQEGGKPRAHYPPFILSRLTLNKITFVLFVAGESGAIAGLSLPPELTGSMPLSLSIVLLTAASGAYLGYRIARTKWFQKALFTLLVIGAFFLTGAVALAGLHSAFPVFSDITVGRATLLLIAVIGAYGGYRIAKTKWFANIELRFLSAYNVLDNENDDSNHRS